MFSMWGGGVELSARSGGGARISGSVAANGDRRSRKTAPPDLRIFQPHAAMRRAAIARPGRAGLSGRGRRKASIREDHLLGEPPVELQRIPDWRRNAQRPAGRESLLEGSDWRASYSRRQKYRPI